MQAPEQSAANEGFTLIEVIISFIVLAMVLGSITVSVSYSARLHRASEVKQLAVGCAERIVAEKFGTAPSLPTAETGDANGCRWRLTRRVVRPAFADSARNLIAFQVEVLNTRGVLVDAFETYYIESAP